MKTLNSNQRGLEILKKNFTKKKSFFDDVSYVIMDYRLIDYLSNSSTCLTMDGPTGHHNNDLTSKKKLNSKIPLQTSLTSSFLFKKKNLFFLIIFVQNKYEKQNNFLPPDLSTNGGGENKLFN